jgi:membrane protein YdbS with pleckstrin-like domain
MGYAEKQLVPGEVIIYRAKYHWVFYRRAIALLVLAVAVALLDLFVLAKSPSMQAYTGAAAWVAGGLLVLSLLLFLGLLIRARADEFVVTDRRVIHKMGVFAHETRQCPLSKVQDITVDQSVWSRLLGYGDVFIETASEAGQMRFPSIEKPELLRTAIWTHVGPGGLAAAPGAPAAAGAPGKGAPSPSERMSRLEELKSKGLITPEEFEEKRRQIVKEL